MFKMTHIDNSDLRTTETTMTINDEDITLEKMFANFMIMMHKIGYHDGSWNAIIDNVEEWRKECGDDWAEEYSGEIVCS